MKEQEQISEVKRKKNCKNFVICNQVSAWGLLQKFLQLIWWYVTGFSNNVINRKASKAAWMNAYVLAMKIVYPTEKNTTKHSWKMEFTIEVANCWRQTQQKGGDCLISPIFSRSLKLETYKSCNWLHVLKYAGLYYHVTLLSMMTINKNQFQSISKPSPPKQSSKYIVHVDKWLF